MFVWHKTRARLGTPLVPKTLEAVISICQAYKLQLSPST